MIKLNAAMIKREMMHTSQKLVKVAPPAINVDPANMILPAINLNKAGKQLGKFAKNQRQHLVYQGITWGGMEIAHPSPDLGVAVTRKIGIDLVEALSNTFMVSNHSLKKVNVGEQCTNVFAYLADGVRLVASKFSKK